LLTRTAPNGPHSRDVGFDFGALERVSRQNPLRLCRRGSGSSSARRVGEVSSGSW